MGSTLAVARQIPEVILELLRAQPLLAVAGEDRLDRRLLVDLVDDDNTRPLYLGLTEGVHPAMQVLTCRHRRNSTHVLSSAGISADSCGLLRVAPTRPTFGEAREIASNQPAEWRFSS